MQLTVATLNLRYDKPDSGDRNWQVRRAAIASFFTHYAPDVIGTQEGEAHQLLDLHRLLPDYQSVGGDRAGTGTGEHCAIFYRTQRLQCLETGDFYLSDTPEIPGSISPDWGNYQPRMTTWATFAVANEAKKITLLNTHLDYDSARARELGAKLIRDRIFPSIDSLFFLTGDFNAAPDTVPRQTLASSLSQGVQLHDALAGMELDEQMTFHDFTSTGFDAVDTIYCDSRVSLREAKVDAAHWQGVLLSDHFPVVAWFSWNISPHSKKFPPGSQAQRESIYGSIQLRKYPDKVVLRVWYS